MRWTRTSIHREPIAPGRPPPPRSIGNGAGRVGRKPSVELSGSAVLDVHHPSWAETLITDFVSYLSKKEQLILGGRLGLAAGEDDLLAYYLRNLDGAGEHGFIIPPGFSHIFVDEGLWGEFERHPQRAAQLQANAISYSWDALIETSARHIFAGTQHFTTHPDIRGSEKIFRFMAREPRTRRRMLARLLHGLIDQTPERNYRAARVVEPSRPGDPYYVFLLLSKPEGMPDEEYREVRLKLLGIYCQAVKLRYPQAEDIVGIATETGTLDVRSEDALYYDARVWTEQDRGEAQSLVDDLGLLGDIRQFTGVEHEYPEPASTRATVPRRTSGSRMKGRDRNSPCPCGSGIKYKRCCGR